KMDVYMDDVLHSAASLIRSYIQTGNIFALVGPSGAGKTVLVEKVIDQYQGNRVVRPCTDRGKMTILHIYTAIMDDLSGAVFFGSLERRARAVRDILLSLKQDAVLILDDAHLLPSETIQSLHALHGICGAFSSPLSIALIGQSQLLRRMDTEIPLREVYDRAQILHTPPVNIRAYIAHKITQAGGDIGDVFTSDGLSHIARPGAAIPLEIERATRNAMEAASDVGEKVSTPVIRHIQKEAA
ncbi:MAG: AAA family ATPase, partial [Gemmatimonadota bacterium]|nr:AAA family ATPase [Gemmatimonadota bacterium]